MATIKTSGPDRDLAIMILEFAVARLKQHRTNVETQDTVKEGK